MTRLVRIKTPTPELMQEWAQQRGLGFDASHVGPQGRLVQIGVPDANAKTDPHRYVAMHGHRKELAELGFQPSVINGATVMWRAFPENEHRRSRA